MDYEALTLERSLLTGGFIGPEVLRISVYQESDWDGATKKRESDADDITLLPNPIHGAHSWRMAWKQSWMMNWATASMTTRILLNYECPFCRVQFTGDPEQLLFALKIVAFWGESSYNTVKAERGNTMGQKEKLIERLKAKPKTFTFDDAESLLRYFGYSRSNKGRTSGSRIMFLSEEHPPILMHKPHPRKELLEYQVKQLIEILEQEGLL